MPTAAINPITIADEGGLELLGNVGEFLVLADQTLSYKPWLATSWTSNAKADVWTFKIRQGVRFNDGSPMTVDDVVYSFQSQCDPKNNSSALSIFSGTLMPDGVVKLDDTTVAFHLEAPDGAFLDAVSCDNYNMIIVPNGYDYSDYHRHWVGTGHFMMSSYTPDVGATFVRNPYYWGTPALPSKVQWTFYASEAPMTAALEANEIDCLDAVLRFYQPATVEWLLQDHQAEGLSASRNLDALRRAPLHEQVRPPGDGLPPRPSRARERALQGRGRHRQRQPLRPRLPGNCQPASGPPARPEPEAGKRAACKRWSGEGLQDSVHHRAETGDAATSPVHQGVRPPRSGSPSTSRSRPRPSTTVSPSTGPRTGSTATMSMVDFGARSTPNLFLEAPLADSQHQDLDRVRGTPPVSTTRPTTSSHRNTLQRRDLSSQRSLAKQIEILLLDETPIIYPYFYNYLSATQKNVTGVYPTALAQFFLWNAALS